MTTTDEPMVLAGASLLDALRARRSTTVFTPEVPPRALVQQVIEAGTWGPNHKHTQPWRFVVIAGEERERFGRFLANLLRPELPDPESEECRRSLDKERAKPLRAPVVVAAGAMPSSHPSVPDIEEIEAVAAGMQNVLLAADALGLGAIWRTGWPAFRDEVREYLGFPEGASIVGFIYLGYPAVPRPPREPEDVSRFISWLETDAGPRS